MLRRAAGIFVKKIIDSATKLRYPFLARGFRIESHLTTSERVRLYNLVRRLDCRVCMEIGSYLGASAFFLAGALARNNSNGVILCIDTWNNDAMTEGNRNTWQVFLSNTEKYRERIVPIHGFSTDVVGEVAARIGTVDLLFIDGDHSYDAVKADWDEYKNFLIPGSVVIFHDYGWAEGVKRVVEEDVLPLVCDHDRLPNMWWGTIAKSP